MDPEDLALQGNDFRAIVSPRRLSDPLFPEDVDVALSTMWFSLRRLDGAVGGGLDVTVASSCLDRIRVVLEWDVDFQARSASDELESSLLRAVEVADYYLDHFRYVARSPHVLRIGQYWRSEDGQFYIQVPHTVSWFNLDDNGSQLSVFEGGANSVSMSGALKSPESGASSLTELNASLRTGAEPPLHLSLLVDADGYIQTLGLREATLSLASACEIAAQLLIERSGGKSDSRIKSVLDTKGISFADRFYNRVPEVVSGSGFELGWRENFEAVEELYRQRNSLIHSGKFRDNLSKLPRSERQKIMHSWLLAARTAVEWIDGISPSA